MKGPALSSLRASRYSSRQWSEVTETVAEETPVALVYNGHSHAVMMASPQDLDDFALGFSLSEGIVDEVGEIEIVDRLHTSRGISLQMLIPQASFEAVVERQRSLSGRTGCGLCGSSSLEAAIRPIRRIDASPRVSAVGLLDAFAAMEMAQPMNRLSGAVHAASMLTLQDELLIREDVGRHNAVDKVIGAAAQQALQAAALLVTSRASYEIVHKAAQARCPIVAAISAPTAMAVRLAEEAGITLVGFARNRRLTVYCGDLPAEPAAPFSRPAAVPASMHRRA
ncbi:formate dehydrogenase accessory sulfurtransferase FdhD [Solimonas sp. SE-A11]|uniref:formate dehydrogenase accessory sulfurtransferase FdhD n=1 Tax=Solimonas sp. SE-A11 TaxID=3054954 RepID=UPI00259C9835|nr:formate dehydrogenase accessory sulfurtransferase FdhD [Solimonas sp. SE-A11]MDM4769872.1 formate dehydrogenase accessory sulfurtransferase FdhD [Solimonas sp. SE-A11]